MRGRINSVVVYAVLTMLVCVIALADTNVPQTPPPSRSAMGALIHPFPIGPVDSLDRARPISGKITLVVRYPKDKKILTVEYLVDSKSVGKVSEYPFKFEYDTSLLANGDHIVKAVGFDAEGKEVWSTSVKAAIGAKPARLAAEPGRPTPANQPINQRSRPEHSPAAISTEQPLADTSKQPKVPANGPHNYAPEPSTNVESAGMSLSNIYDNKTLNFSIRYPRAWTSQDKSDDMKPKQKGNAWILFGTDPVDRATVVVNLKRMELEASTDVDTFAKYNSYVKTWKRTALLGSSAFVTTDGKPENKRVIHRAIIIKDGCAWMFNCIDTSGKPDSESKKLFDSMINSLSTLKPVVPTVTITESITE